MTNVPSQQSLSPSAPNGSVRVSLGDALSIPVLVFLVLTMAVIPLAQEHFWVAMSVPMLGFTVTLSLLLSRLK